MDSIQPKLQHVNAVGQGLIQSAAKHTDTQALEHDLETTNLQWNSLNKRVRVTLKSACLRSRCVQFIASTSLLNSTPSLPSSGG